MQEEYCNRQWSKVVGRIVNCALYCNVSDGLFSTVM